jgi:hypothetical protein
MKVKARQYTDHPREIVSAIAHGTTDKLESYNSTGEEVSSCKRGMGRRHFLFSLPCLVGDHERLLLSSLGLLGPQGLPIVALESRVD